MALTTISPHDAQELIARGAKLIDIRDADEYLREHIPEAVLLLHHSYMYAICW